MFEAHVLHLLRKYLGAYVQGLSAEALRISVWKGDVVLRDLKLKAEALNSLKLPVTVKVGFVGTITLKVPWKSLGKDPVIVLIDRVFVLAHPAPDGRSLKEEDREKLFEAKLQQIEEAESATLEAKARMSKLGNTSGGNSWLGSLIATVIGNLKISISNVHIRYEDTVSNPGHPFCSGITLARLAAVTMDEQGNETFDTSGALDKLRKSLQLQRLAVYHDSDSLPWRLDKKWEDLTPKDWIEIFEDGINEPDADGALISVWALNRKYVVSPINGVLKYHRLGKQERKDLEIPFEKAALVLSNVSLTVTEAQYYDVIKLLEVISRFKTHVEVSHLRPRVPVLEEPYAWWHYAAQAGLQQKKLCYRFSWESVKHLCQLRRRYIQLYASSLQGLSKLDNSELKQIEKDLDCKVILLWRLLAHAKVESVRSKEAAQQRGRMKRNWWSFGWRTSSGDTPIANDSEESRLLEDRLTKEEWQTINKILSFQPDEEMSFPFGKDSQNMIQFLVDISIGQAAARIVNIKQTEIVCGRFEQLRVTTKLYPKRIQCDLTLRFYGLYAPEGSLSQSVSSQEKVNALAATFIHSPSGEDVDWRLSATIAPCHVSVLMESYERFLEFVKRSNAVSPTVALETATALQMKIEQVTRKAQEQFQLVLEEQSRFALDIDFDAPKVRVPMKTTPCCTSHGYFLLDFGHFTLHTKEGQRDEQSLYSRFYISGRDIAAFFVDGSFDSEICNLASSAFAGQLSSFCISDNVDQFYSLIDRCGTSVIIDQIKIPHPRYPSTRVSVQVPNLGIHFSPARLSRIMDLLKIFYSTTESADEMADKDLESGLVAWHPADLSTDARILVWRGIGNSVAEWQPCFLVLSGLYLYVLESEFSQSYQRYSSMAGRQVFEVSPASIGGSQHSVAVSFRGLDIQKALESSHTIIIELQNDEEKAIWMRGLVQATYRASAPPSIDILGEPAGGVSEFGGPRPSTERADLVITGILIETKLLIYGKSEGEHEELEERLILEILAGGGKVNLVHLGGDLTVKMKLHSLKIKDELQGHLSTTPQYLACSVLKDDCNGSELSNSVLEEDDVFTDALPEFTPTPDQSFYYQDLDMPYIKKMSTEIIERCVGIDSTGILVHRNEPVKGKGIPGEIFYEAYDIDTSDFVAVTFWMRHPDSQMYDGTDMQMSIRMSKLDFFCNRPTLVALIGFGLDLSPSNLDTSNISQQDTSFADPSQDKEKTEGNERAYVKGLLGRGKDRVVFHLNMEVSSVCVFLNKEDGLQLAMLVQENFRLDLRIHPSSLSIDGTLGNLKLCDMSLGPDHCWGWLCDTRNQGIESLIKFTFQSYNAEDDDYEGYDYSLSGRLSAVRIVFLYKFVQEINAYFMELANPHTEEVIRFVDKVGGIEWLIQKYEVDGASALKLDLSLDTPIIIVPRNSMSKDFMQLDLGQLHVRNSFSWHGCQETDPSAVHLDVLDAEIHGMNMAVGIDGLLGKPMIREGQGIHIQVRRSLRDVFRKVPTISLEVRVGLLHGVISDKEYNVILDCAYMNIYEEPHLPPSFRDNTSDQKDSLRMLADKVNFNSQALMSRSVFLVLVEVNYALLELCIGIDDGSPLAHVALEGLWVSNRTTSLYERDLYVTIPKFSILDIRPDTKPEMRLMLGSSSDVSSQGIFRNSGSVGDLSVRKSSQESTDTDPPNLTMLLVDYRLRQFSQSFVVRIQQPRVLVVLDFLLAVAEYFVPSLGAITGREESLHPENDPIIKGSHIVLSNPVYEQKDNVVHLSPNRQLIADAYDVDEFTYDGCGGTLCLSQEYVSSESLSPSARPIIIIGCGKKLQFKNVKIENAVLLRKCIYMGNDSSYSVSTEDGVDISLLENQASEMDNSKLDHSYGTSNSSNAALMESSSGLSEAPSFTFEAQVESPEFTFYDSKKDSLDDSLHGEKLLRIKMDMSFMYAAKEKGTWMWALVKDLSIEAGSGLVILDPVDISGGYTSIKDKTNMSVVSTDICIRLSLSVISLVLNLQNQAAAALQFGNATSLSSCTNFDGVWSQKGNVRGYNLTIWRPRAPPNYVILGDCVTSRPTPPSQAVMAVSNTYGRVRKPLGFNLIGFISNSHGMEGDQPIPNGDDGCSLWMPIAPSGYLALGCVAQIGSEPPPNYIVYCIRSDLVTSTTFADCISSVPPNPRFLSGFSIWRVDNVVGSFYAHATTQCPPKITSCDLREILRRVPDPPRSPSTSSTPNPSVENDTKNRQANNSSTSATRWDILRSISRSSYYLSTPHFERIWWDKGGDLRRSVSIWRPQPRSGFSILGDCIIEGLEPPAFGLLFKNDSSGISAKPVQFTKIAHIVGKGLEEAFFWYPVAPPGYASLGCVISRTDDTPCIDSLRCLRMDIVNQTNISEVPITKSSSSKGTHCWSIWKVENQACTFLARSDWKKPSNRLAYSIADHVKPKAREDVGAVMKLKCFSLTVLDSLCGTMTPLFDVTVTDLNLASHGRFEAINAVLTSSIAASTFNTQLEAWEPLVEPFDGIFKFESSDTDTHLPSRITKRVRVAATSTVNLNLSAANIGTFSGSVVSWQRQKELELMSMNTREEAGINSRDVDNPTRSALEEDDLQKVFVENKLGCDIYLKKISLNSKTIELLKHSQCAPASLPPPRFSDRLNVATDMRQTRNYVAVHILESRGLDIVDDGNSHDFFCALRLIADNQASDQQKLFPQSARTRSIRTSRLETDKPEDGIARWNELFIFEVPWKGGANLEVEVTNLGAKAGKGEVVGAFSIPIGDGAKMTKDPASPGMLQETDDVKMLTYPLKRGDRLNKDGEAQNCGCLVISISYFKKETHPNFQNEMTSTVSIDGDVGFWVALDPKGPWERFRSLLPLSVVPKTLNDDFFAFEVVMKNGKKHAIFRSLAVVVNDTDVKLELSICPASMLDSRNLPTSATNSHSIVIEEIFENQRYQPISGWGYKRLGFTGNDPERWSARDLSYSSKDFMEPSLPPGWQWTSDWSVEKSRFVDNDGWAYGPDYQSLKWPPTSSKSRRKSALDFVRQRRWVRTRQPISEKSSASSRDVLSLIRPGSSTVLPWCSMARNSDLCLQVRPYVEHPHAPYLWSHIVSVGSNDMGETSQSFLNQSPQSSRSTSQFGNNLMPFSVFKLSQLGKKDVLLASTSSNANKHFFWLSVGTDASVLHTELNSPVYDWKISVNAPLKIENRLPCSADYAIWEKSKEGNRVQRQHGTVSSGSSAFIYLADVQKPIYLTWFPQGGWFLERNPILILDPSALDQVSSFWMVHQQSNRRLRVSIERDLGGTTAAPKTIRLFVPYWISNDTSLPLAYHIVEVEPWDNAETDSILLTKVVKSAKLAVKHPSNSADGRKPGSRKNVQILEVIEELSSTPVMLSPQDYTSRSGILPFPSRNDGFLSPRLGIAVAIRPSERYSPGISIVELENKERIDVNAFSSNGSYYKLSAVLSMASDRTKVVHFQPQTVFINRIGRSLCLQQCDSHHVEWFHPTDPAKLFRWQSAAKNELLQLRFDGYKWSAPFSVGSEGLMRVPLKNDMGNCPMFCRVEVRHGTKSSRYEVIFRPASSSSPYRIENRSMFLPIRFRQVGGTDISWLFLPPNTSSSFFWEDLGRQRLLEVLVNGADPLKSEKYNIDEIFDHQPVHIAGGPVKALRLTIQKEGKMHIVKISDWMPTNEPIALTPRRTPFLPLPPSQNDFQETVSGSDCEFHVIVELAEMGLSIIDHAPEEILYVSVQNLLVSYSTGMGSGVSRFKLRMAGFQVDNQLPLTPMPVLFRPQRSGDQLDYILKLSITLQSNGSADFYAYPYLGLQGPQNSVFLVNIHEPVIWRLHEMFQHVNPHKIVGNKTTVVPVDPIIQIGLLNISEIRFKVSMTMSPSQRPRGVLGFWSSLMTALGNTEHMPIRINQRFHEDICMRQSALISTAISNIQKDLLSQPLQLLSGVDILGNASSALGHMSKGVAALSMDKKFIQGRQRQESKGVEDIGDVIREGGGAFAKGLFRGVTGILTKPLEGAKTSGVEGFVQGVGKGIIGAAAQPVSGVLDLLSKTTEGANAVRMKIASAITSEEQLLRRRLPRVINGDNVLRPFDEYKAQGQVILQLAESGAFFGQMDLFKVRGKFALSDAYEDHFILPEGKILMVTHRRVIFLQQPSQIMSQKKFNPARDPCSVLWDVSWKDLATMELMHGKKDQPRSPPSQLVLYLQNRSMESKDCIRVVKCHHESQQAAEIYSSIERAMNAFGPNHSKEMQKRKVTKPYAPCSGGICPEAVPKEVFVMLRAQEASVPMSTTFGMLYQ